ncbi:serine/threonine-protein kinase/endoribonuclease IRE1 [Macrosteles quadrilineatus]|uniref:serine/threonine-protein kinase/endoribonuclease IRE1 n=1 Tax=Macrosteles quadrilineatus TaxID=74068 RepID=UPI0023E13B0D|nr:serine/threonine-protein kinase/endoribonuclease IRE1 [Macrosteles quadrilineatus]
MGLFKHFCIIHFTFLLLISLLLRTKCLVLGSTTSEHLQEKDVHRQSTGLIKDADSLLVLSMLDGSLIGVDHLTGLVRWRLHNDPVVKVPPGSKSALEPVFLPDPKDGSLYMLASGPTTGRMSTLKKLPFTIQQLVASSPCRGSDGMFYTGRKIDSWFSVNWKTGKKTPVLSFDQLEKSCPVPALDDIFIGRTEYNILMYDSKNKNRQWNVTFFDYSTQTMSSEDVTNYGFVHFGASSSGRVSTYDRSSGRLLWDRDFGSPLVGVFLRQDQDVTSVPFTSVEDKTLDRLALSHDRDQLYPSLYVGEHRHGFYALPTLVGQHSSLILPTQAVLLIEGPNTTDTPNSLLGHYPVPDYSTTRLQIAGRSDVIIPPVMGGFNGSKVGGGVPTAPARTPQNTPAVVEWFVALEHKPLYFFVFLLIVSMAALFFYVQAQVQALQQSQHSSRGSSRDSWGSAVTAASEVMSDGTVRVGKINFDTTQVLGKGCEGTFVFRGQFESRAVAVKRLLPECFTVADREVSLLRESDAHANVVRYFCTEQDSQFRYIALELCAATLQDYVEKQVFNEFLNHRDVLSQATSGLSHLHSLNIVHRDIKPHNVLLSMPTIGGQVRAMISDFGLCKKLQNGRTSFSRRSGVTGTDGWIAPEIILGNSRTMCQVDIFSLGCVFYYVLSQGRHPFGDTLHRQANILSNSYKLAGLSVLWQGLVELMISCEPHHRPPADVVLHHPALWDSSRALTFLQDCSDRVEKEDVTGPVLATLETGASSVCVRDWRSAVDDEVTADLRKYRSYRGDSVRDLLRALRNKRHHFRELSPSAQELLGSTADSFTSYWLSRFPLLLPHSWVAMQCVRQEPLFVSYYQGNYTFPPPPTDSTLPPWYEEKVQELLEPKKQPSKSPRHLRRGSDLNDNSSPKDRRKFAEDSPKDKRKFGDESPRNTRKQGEGNENEEVERENWLKSGQEKGVYRPRMRRKPRKKEEENIVWTVPTT